MDKIKPGYLSERQCAECGDPVSIDALGRCLCYSCGGFVDSVDPGTIAKPPKGKDVQIPLFKMGWGLPK